MLIRLNKNNGILKLVQNIISLTLYLFLSIYNLDAIHTEWYFRKGQTDSKSVEDLIDDWNTENSGAVQTLTDSVNRDPPLQIWAARRQHGARETD